MNSFSMDRFRLETIFKTNDISYPVQQHLSRVYATLAATTLTASLGVILDLQMHIGGLMTLFGSIGVMTWLTSVNQREEYKRLALMMAFGLLQGLSVGSLVDVALVMDPSIVVTALLGTTTIFLCLTGSALVAKRRAYMFLGGILSSTLAFMMMLLLVNVFLRSAMIFNVHLYLGLFVFCLYVLFDTQVIIEKASLGNKDYIMDAGLLFMDLVAIFVRIILVLIKNSSGKERKDRRRRYE